MTGDRGALGEWVREQCRRYRRHLLARKVVSEGEMQEVWPTDDAPLKAWVICYGQLRAWLWIQDDVPGTKDSAEERLLKALREAPESVTLSDGSRVNVYPKGLGALLWFRTMQGRISDLHTRSQIIVERARRGGHLPDEIMAGPTDVLIRVARELAYQLALMAAVACEEGPRLPKWATSERRPPRNRVLAWSWRLVETFRRNPVARFLALDSVDHIAVNRAFLEVNAGRLGALKYILPPRKANAKPGDSMSYNVFVGTLAMKTGQDPEYLANDRSLVSLVAQVDLANPDPIEELEDAW